MPMFVAKGLPDEFPAGLRNFGARLFKCPERLPLASWFLAVKDR